MKLAKAENLSNLERNKEAREAYEELLSELEQKEEMRLNAMLQFAFFLAKIERVTESNQMIKEVKRVAEERGKSEEMGFLFE